MLQKIATFYNWDKGNAICIEYVEQETVYIVYDNEDCKILNGSNYLMDFLEYLDKNAKDIEILEPFQTWLNNLDEYEKEEYKEYFKNKELKVLFYENTL